MQCTYATRGFTPSGRAWKKPVHFSSTYTNMLEFVKDNYNNNIHSDNRMLVRHRARQWRQLLNCSISKLLVLMKASIVQTNKHDKSEIIKYCRLVLDRYVRFLRFAIFAIAICYL